MKRMKQSIVLLLVLAMTIGAFSGCGSSNNNTTNSGSDSTTTQATATPAPTSAGSTTDSSTSTDTGSDTTATAEEGTAAANGIILPELDGDTLSLTVSIADFNQSSDGTEMQQLWQEKMEKYLGCTLDITWQRTPWADFRTNELVVLQSGQVPDVSSYSQGTAINEYGDDGIVLNLADYKDYMYYYPEYVNDTNGGEAFAYNADGSMYYFMDGFDNTQDIQGAQSFTGFAYRFDVLQANNLTPATTLDEFTTLCASLQGLIDSGASDAQYVMMNSTKDYAFYRGFVGIYHTWDTLYWNGSEWAFGPVEDNFREMLAYLNTLWDAGYIDPEMGTADYNAGTTKASTGVALVCPNLWAGSVAGWNTATTIEGLEWGLAYLPENTDYGTAWKWGSKQDGKSLNSQMGIYISADVANPEYVVAMIDYQYSDEMVEMMNWGVEGETYTASADGNTFSDAILSAESPATEVANYGIMSSSVCRSGIPFTPLDFSAMTSVSSIPEPWWNATKGYYEGKYWIESDANGGADSVSPYDRPPVLRLTADESTAKSQLSSACETYAREYAYKFITGELDINSDSDWDTYVQGVKSQSEEDFDATLEMLDANSVIN